MAGEEAVSTTRRAMLRSSSLGGLALLISSCTRTQAKAETVEAESDEDYCVTGRDRAPTPPTDAEFKQAAEELWRSFDDGTLAWTKTVKVELAPGVKDDRQHYHGVFVKRNWHKWQRCERLVNQCAWSAGFLAAMLSEKVGTKTITKDHFEAAARAVGDMQRHGARNPETFTTISC